MQRDADGIGRREIEQRASEMKKEETYKDGSDGEEENPINATAASLAPSSIRSSVEAATIRRGTGLGKDLAREVASVPYSAFAAASSCSAARRSVRVEDSEYRVSQVVDLGQPKRA